MIKLPDGTKLVRRRVWRLTDGSCHIEEPGRDVGAEVMERMRRDPRLRVSSPRRGEDRWVYVPQGWRIERTSPAGDRTEAEVLQSLRKLWLEFSEVPVGNDDGIERDWLGWPKGTDRMEIWHWFDERCPHGLVRDLLLKEVR